MSAPVVWWIRRDLRLRDNPALDAAADTGAVVPLFVVDEALWARSGDVRRAWMVRSLEALDRAMDGHLVVRRGPPATEVLAVATDAGAGAVHAAEDFGPYGRRRDADVGIALARAGVEVEWTGSPYAVEPGSVVKEDGSPFQVFGPFHRAWAARGWAAAGPPAPVTWADGVEGVALPDAPPVDAELPTAGEEAAQRRWEEFRDGALEQYAARRDEPAGDHTSRLSPYLRWGVLHPRSLLADLDPRRRSHGVYRSELAWREFYADVLWHHPGSARRSLKPALASLHVDRGQQADSHFEAWATGRTGYPIVDAGMRQLLGQGWMHNRVRMITASFLVKDLHIDWTRGARHFMRHLVDGDLASNSHGWQWVAGTGTDPAPYFRIFNPTTQGLRFDPGGDYIRQWVPELASLPAPDIHTPWSDGMLSLGGASYPPPVVNHQAERSEALARYQATRSER